MPDVIAQVTIQAGRVTYPPGSVVTIEDADEAKRLVERGDAEWAGEAVETEVEGNGASPNPLAGVNFASDEAAEAAAGAKVGTRSLSAADFEEFEGSGKGGAFTKGDVLAIAAELAEDEEDEEHGEDEEDEEHGEDE